MNGLLVQEIREPLHADHVIGHLEFANYEDFDKPPVPLLDSSSPNTLNYSALRLLKLPTHFWFRKLKSLG